MNATCAIATSTIAATWSRSAGVGHQQVTRKSCTCRRISLSPSAPADDPAPKQAPRPER